MKYRCKMCGYIYDDAKEKVKFEDLPGDWTCPVCGAPKSLFEKVEEAPAQPEVEKTPAAEPVASAAVSYIQQIAATGKMVIESAGATTELSPWQDVLIMAGQLAHKPLASDVAIDTEVILGKTAKQPLKLKVPLMSSHMSYGALTGETKVTLAKGASQIGAAVGSGEGGLYEPEFAAAANYIFEYVPNKYSVTDENLRRVGAIEIKIGQSAKPGIGGHLPGSKVTPEIAKMRGFPEGEDIISPPAFPEINSADDLKKLVDDLRARSAGRPIGIKIAANNIEEDLAWIKIANPDFITLDGRGGGTGAAPKLWKETAGVPTLYALVRARRYLDENQMPQQLIVTGGLRTSADIVKCLALGADIVALATAVLTAIAAPVELDNSQKLANFYAATLEELCAYARACGLSALRDFGMAQLTTTSDTVATYTPIRHVGM